MARRSVMNDRYRVEQKGHTRKSASSAKPKREAGTATAPAKKPVAKKRSFWSRATGGQSSSKTATPVPSTPEMKRLRRIWWVFMGFAIVIAFGMVPIAKYKIGWLDTLLFALYAVALGGALYLEFGPLRKARLAAVAAAKDKGKGAKTPAKGKSDTPDEG